MSRRELVDSYLGGQMSRRVFIRRLVRTGMSVAAAVAFAGQLSPAFANNRGVLHNLYHKNFYSGKGHLKKPHK
jgi:hypothetical protein